MTISFILYENVDSILKFVSLNDYSPGLVMTDFRAIFNLFLFHNSIDYSPILLMSLRKIRMRFRNLIRITETNCFHLLNPMDQFYTKWRILLFKNWSILHLWLKQIWWRKQHNWFWIIKGKVGYRFFTAKKTYFYVYK